MVETNKKTQETEVKLYVQDLDVIRERLDAAEARLVVPRVYEHNLRYDDEKGTLASQRLVLRLRRDNEVRLTYKEPMNPDAQARGVHQRYEAEVSVSDFDTMHTILQKLGFTTFMVYEKYRTTYQLNGAEVVLDEMPYGNFVEIEADSEAIIEYVIGKLDLKNALRIPYSYAQLFLHVRAHLKMTSTDLTFANFEGIQVSRAVFEPPEAKS